MSPESPVAGANKKGLYRRSYEWILHWAYTPLAQPVLFVLAFAESSFFPIPPDVLLIPMCLGDRLRALRFALICSVASVLGGMLGYWLGTAFWATGLREFCFQYMFSEKGFERVQGLYREWDFWVVFTAGFTPIPYKIFTICGGVFQIDFPMFVLASAVSRSARFFLVAGLLRIWGEPVRTFIDRRLGLVSIAAVVLLVGGFALLKFVL